MNQDSLAPKKPGKKFLFDAHDFDTTGLEEAAPVFSQDELAAARQSAYEQGKKDGLAEAHASFERQTADLLAAIRDHFSILFDEEDRRSRMFEKESVQLAYSVFARAFQALNEKFGLLEVKTTVKKVLETYKEQPEIIVEIPQAYVDVIQGHIDHILRQDGGPRCLVRASPALGPGQCKMTWANGHALRNGHKIAEEIGRQIEVILADKPVLTDNEGEALSAGEPTDASLTGESP